MSTGVIGAILVPAVLGAILAAPIVSYVIWKFGSGVAVGTGGIVSVCLIIVIGIPGGIGVLIVGVICLGFGIGAFFSAAMLSLEVYSLHTRSPQDGWTQASTIKYVT